jgi:hypothetical protein
VLTAALMGVAATAGFAADGGSSYSMMGLGDLRAASGVRSIGMGSAGTALQSAQYINLDAPATWSLLSRIRLEGGFLYEGFNSTDGMTSRYLAKLGFQEASIGFPVSTQNGMALVIGVAPYSNVNFDTYQSGTGVTSLDTIPYTMHHTGTGGVGVGKIGMSWTPIKEVSVGASFDYYFGLMEYTRTYIPDNTTYGGMEVNKKTSFRGSGATVGILWSSLGRIAEVLKPFSLGLTVSSRVSLTSPSQSSIGYGSNILAGPSEVDTTAEYPGQAVIPLRLTIGAAYNASDRLVAVADYSMQQWTQSSFDGFTPATLRDMSRIGVGIERVPLRELDARWLDKVSVRFGAAMTSTYYNPRSTAITEWVLTAGFSMPISPDARLHLAAEYGWRGTTTNNLVRDRIFRLSGSLSLSELWFVRQDED